MEPVRTNRYRIEPIGAIGEEAVNRERPCAVALTERGRTSTTFSVDTDQAGMIGLMCYLHGIGFSFIRTFGNIRERR